MLVWNSFSAARIDTLDLLEVCKRLWVVLKIGDPILLIVIDVTVLVTIDIATVKTQWACRHISGANFGVSEPGHTWLFVAFAIGSCFARLASSNGDVHGWHTL